MFIYAGNIIPIAWIVFLFFTLACFYLYSQIKWEDEKKKWNLGFNKRIRYWFFLICSLLALVGFYSTGKDFQVYDTLENQKLYVKESPEKYTVDEEKLIESLSVQDDLNLIEVEVNPISLNEINGDTVIVFSMNGITQDSAVNFKGYIDLNGEAKVYPFNKE